MEITLEQRQQEINRVTWIGVFINILLAVSKLIGGFIANSHALIADGVHSFSDLISDGIVLVASKHAHQEADENHPYGHGRFETLATIGVGVFLILVGIGICLDAIERLDTEASEIPTSLALWLAAFSIIANEFLYQVTIRVGRRINSKMLIANAWHHRTDSLSSIIVLIGVAGAIAGWAQLDGIAAFIVALMIIKIGWDLSHHSLRELVDTALEPEKVEAIKNAILDVDGVVALHMLRTRSMGPQAIVDVHIIVDSNLSVSEGHRISDAVATTLRKTFTEINDVTIHIDPEDDEFASTCKHLPLRKQVTAQLEDCWQDITEGRYEIDTRLHYLNGKINIEAIVPLDKFDSLQAAEDLRSKLQSATSHIDYIRQVDVFFR